MKLTKRILLVTSVIFVLLNIYWQYDYEQVIKEAKLKCSSISQRRRIKYTPIIIHKLQYLFDKQELYRDRLLYNLLLKDCVKVDITGYQLMYLTHIYLSEKEKDSLLVVYNAEIKRGKKAFIP